MFTSHALPYFIQPLSQQSPFPTWSIHTTFTHLHIHKLLPLFSNMSKPPQNILLDQFYYHLIIHPDTFLIDPRHQIYSSPSPSGGICPLDLFCTFRREMTIGSRCPLDLEIYVIQVLTSLLFQRSDFSSPAPSGWRCPMGLQTYVYYSIPDVLRISKIALFWKLDIYFFPNFLRGLCFSCTFRREMDFGPSNIVYSGPDLIRIPENFIFKIGQIV